jgi:predicted aldo/keto reductase-like oxidoreductase
MEPLRGGSLAKEPPPAVAKVWDTAKKRSRVEWALQWLWNQPEISVVLSGMSAMQQVMDNVVYAGRSGPNTLTADDLAIFKKVKDAYQGLAPVPCTACRYCQPCPNGVDIPRIFELYNNSVIYDDPRLGAFAYAGPGPGGLKPEQRADNCKECGECEKVCPQQIKIPEALKKAHKALTSAGGGPGGRPPGPPPGPEPV